MFFNSANKGGVNTSFYGVPEVDQLLNQANEETDVAKRKDLFSQAERRIVDDAPWLFIGHMKQQVAHSQARAGLRVAADVYLLLQQRQRGLRRHEYPFCRQVAADPLAREVTRR